LPENMKNAASKGFINATDCADFLVKKGLPFRDAYKITGGLVAFCIENNKTLETLTLDEYKSASEVFDNGIYEAISLENCVEGRNAQGGPSKSSVMAQIENIKQFIETI
jgi:argininosuccinate lyase